MASTLEKNTDRMVRRYARLHGTSDTMAINMAVSEALKREGHAEPSENQEQRMRALRAAIREAQRAWREMPTLDPRDHAEMLYDEDGIPK